jgi:transmembrane sensor
MRRTNDKDIRLDLDPVKDEALQWVERLTSGRATPSDAEALQRWRRQSTAHAAAFTEASKLWKNIGSAGRNLRLRGEASAELASASRSMGRRAFLTGGATALAATAAYGIVRPPLGLWPSWEELTADYRTATGEQRELTLNDSVMVRLNTKTSLSVQSADGSVGQIRLVAGEASFTAMKQSANPLVVLAADGRTIAQGARFDVRHLDGSAGRSVCITCIEGNVRVEQHDDSAVIGSGQQLRYDGYKLGPTTAVDPTIVTAWQHGVLIFRATPLVEVVEEINRYRPGKVVVVNEALGRSPVSGRFRIDHMEEIFDRLEKGFGAKFRTLPAGIVLLS